jgi:hypothetical protein
VVVSAATDGKVHVTDHTHVWGWLLGSRPDSTVHVSRTTDGVAIRRGDGQPQPAVAMLGIYFQRTEVGVPPGTLVDIRSCDGASLSGVRADDVRIACDDGSLHLDDVQSASIDAVTKGGSIHASDLNVRGGRLETGSGDIHVALLDPDLRLHAQTGDGRIRINGHRVANNYQPGGIDYRFGSGDGSLDITTQDGSIRITSNGAH